MAILGTRFGGFGGADTLTRQNPILPKQGQFNTALGFIGQLSDPLQQSVQEQRNLYSSLLGPQPGMGTLQFGQPGFQESAGAPGLSQPGGPDSQFGGPGQPTGGAPGGMESIPGFGALRGVFAQAGQGAAQQINQAITNKANNVSGNLAARGLGGSSLMLTENLAVEREGQQALGGLLDSLLGRQIQTQTDISGNISNLLQGAAGQQFNLLNALIGDEQTTDEGGSGDFGSSRGVVSGGGGGGRASSSGGGGGGGGGFGTAAGLQTPAQYAQQVIEALEAGKRIAQLIPDSGPIQTPDEFAANKAISDAARAQGAFVQPA